MDVGITVTGADDIAYALGRVPNSTRKKIIRPGLRKGGNVIKNEAVQNIESVVSDKATGFLAKNVVVRSVRAQNKSDVRVAVTIRPGEVLNPLSHTRVGLYGSVLEFGKEGQPPKPWLRPAQRSKAQETVNALVQTGHQYLQEVVDEAKR